MTQEPTKKIFSSSEVRQTKCEMCKLVCSVPPVSVSGVGDNFRAICAYEAKALDELSFNKNSIISLTAIGEVVYYCDDEDEEACKEWTGVLNGVSGTFPSNCVTPCSFYCGRCRPQGTPDSHFEESAKKVLFPCAFGCGTHIIWGRALEHEIYCENRTAVCPFTNCTATSTLQDLHKHIRTFHVAYDQETPKLYRSIRTHGNTYLQCITFDKFVILLFAKLCLKSDIVNFQYNGCLVWPQQFGTEEFHNMQLRLEIEVPQSDIKIIKLIQCKNIGKYYDRSHCENCMLQSCEKILHENKCNLPFHNIVFHVEDNSEVELFYTFKVYKKETASGKVPDSLECPVCMHYMMNEIYLCENGHSLCDKCNGKLSDKKCPTCRGNMPNTRNYSMEKLVRQINDVPCRKRLTGCKFVGLVADVLVHEKSCKY